MDSSNNNNNNNNAAFKLENLFSVKGKVALVTGGGTGIGLMATQALAVNGAKVYIVGRSGTVINISSISGMVNTSQHHFAYNASKAAAIHLSSMLASEISAANRIKVRVNSIAPGVFPSEMTAKESGSDQKSELPKEKYETKTTARRPGRDEDMGNAVLFVATNQYLSGQFWRRAALCASPSVDSIVRAIMSNMVQSRWMEVTFSQLERLLLDPYLSRGQEWGEIQALV